MDNTTASLVMPTARPLNVTDVVQNVTMRLNVTNTTALLVVPTARPVNVTMRHNVTNTTALPVMPTARPVNVTGVVQNVTMRQNVTNTTALPVVPTARPLNVTMRQNVTNTTALPVMPTARQLNVTMRDNVTNTTALPMMPTARPLNVTDVMQNVTMRHNVTVSMTTRPRLPLNMTTSENVTTTIQTTTQSSTCSTPCHLYASCVSGQSGYTCVCSSGYQGNGVTCTLAAQQVSLEMTMNLPYTSDLADSNSQAFRTLAQTVSSKIFIYLSSSSSGLLSVTVTSFRSGSVVAVVNANFQQNASVDSSSVVNNLKQAVANDPDNPLGVDTSSLTV
uniref:EGF-like domain-containing protein n=1 Tax=Branchiostoma floridae TaxID=7739 RepID=C3Y4I4_BRAFL|eukprot:XP_002608848.1 hypothetical protein BRAFLDRAFT_89719 [Branchiostoma floridae]